MNKGCWKVDEDDKEEDNDVVDDDNKEYSKWCDLPDLLLEKIFSYLSIRQKYYSSLVCRNWYRVFRMPYVWSQFVLEDSTLTRARFNYYSGWQYILDHSRTQMCLTKVGRHFKSLIFEPMLNFYNLYEFMNIVSWFIEEAVRKNVAENGAGCKIKHLKFTFPCNMASRDETERIRLFGTGGKLLQELKRLMGNLRELKRLELIDLMLDVREAQHLLDEVCEVCYLALHTLILVNTTRVYCPLLHVGVFLNLHVLYISPQNLGEDAVELLGHTRLKHLHVYQNQYTPADGSIKSTCARSWKSVRKLNPGLRVHLEVHSTKEREIIWQTCAPVRTVLYESPQAKLTSESILTAIELYGPELEAYCHKCLPRFHRSKAFHERVDSLLLLLCRHCPRIHTLVIRERISTSTVLLLAFAAKRLETLYIRRNAVILRCDWPRSPEWTDEFYEWLKSNSRSYDCVEREVSQILGHKWRMLTDKEFKAINIKVHN